MQIDAMTNDDVTHHACAVAIVCSEASIRQACEHIRGTGQRGCIASLIRQGARRGFMRQRDVSAASVFAREKMSNRIGERRRRCIDRAVLQCDADLLRERLMDARRQTVRNRMAKNGVLKR
jgi:hypothetical protein